MPTIHELGNGHSKTVHVTQSAELEESYTIPEGTTVIFDPGVVLTIEVDNVPALVCESNTVILGNGAVVKGTGVGEHQHAVAIWSAKNVFVDNLHAHLIGGDGVYVGLREFGDGACFDIRVHTCLATGVGRNGVSVVSCRNAIIASCVADNTDQEYGSKGVVIEPSHETQPVTDIVVAYCSALRRGTGVFVNMARGLEVGVDVIGFRTSAFTHPESAGVRSTCANDRGITGHVRFAGCDGPVVVDERAAAYTEVR